MADQWAALITAVAALGGVALSQWEERRRQRIRWERESHAKQSEDRRLAYTKFLNCAEEVISRDNDRGLTASLDEAENSLSLLADEDTSRAAYDLAATARRHWLNKDAKHLPEPFYQQRATFLRAAKKSLGIDLELEKIE